jgi:putative FmdB family regulatory protein
MPMFDFTCQKCQTTFEALVRKDNMPACPACGSSEIEKQLSLPSLKTSTTHGLAMQAAKRRDRAQGAEQAYTQRQYELNHDD